jgi:uncharacterized CHY-type Zn-finger protein
MSTTEAVAPHTEASRSNANRRRRPRPKKPSSNDHPDQSNDSSSASNSEPPNSERSHKNNNSKNQNRRPNQRVRQADPSKVVRKPQQSNPKRLSKRDQQIEQLRRAFPDLTSDEHDLTKFRLKLVPTDPDFAFDIQALDFNLYVPLTYPSQPRRDGTVATPSEYPMIIVLNEDIPKGFSANVDIGFKSLAEKFTQQNRTLLDMINALDRDLEGFLKQEKRATIKIVKNNKPRLSSPSNQEETVNTTQSSSQSYKFTTDSAPKVFVPPEVRKERQAQIDKLKHSLGKSAVWGVSSDDLEDVLRISVLVKDPSELPSQMNGQLEFNLHIPKSYGIADPCFIIFPTVVDGFSSSIIENNFNHFLRTHSSWKLYSVVNYLACRISELKREDYELPEAEAIVEVTPQSIEQPSLKVHDEEIQDKAIKVLSLLKKPKLKAVENDTSSESQEPTEAESIDDQEGSGVDEKADEADDEEPENIFEIKPIEPRGIALSSPGLTLTNIGILECNIVNLVVTCDKCSTQNDLFNIVSGPYGRDSKPFASTCTKCKTILACAFQKSLVRQTSEEAPFPVLGYLDVSGCTPVQVLGSSFVPTCGNCTSSNPETVFRRLEPGRTAFLNCKSCKIRMGLKIGSDGYEFTTISDDKLSAERINGVRIHKHDTAKQKLGLTSGQPLPDDGKCTHFRKSTRWFRFSCCGKVYPCEKCHDLESNHPYEYGTRVICGMCSREQNISNTCAYCRHRFENKSNTGFWEGGKGTRDPTKLNKNDSRKFKKMPNSNKNNKGGSSKKSNNSRGKGFTSKDE